MAWKGPLYAPVRVDESAGNANPYVEVTKEAAKTLVEDKGALWYLNPLRGNANSFLLEPTYVAPPMRVG